MPKIFLTIVTDDPHEAIADALCCAMTNKPAWVAVVSDPLEILKLTDEYRCHGLWYTSRMRPSAAYLAWRERVQLGGLRFIDEADHAWIAKWIARHKQAMAVRIAAALGGTVPTDVVEVIEEKTSVLPHPQPELKNLVLSQRWT